MHILVSHFALVPQLGPWRQSGQYARNLELYQQHNDKGIVIKTVSFIHKLILKFIKHLAYIKKSNYVIITIDTKIFTSETCISNVLHYHGSFIAKQLVLPWMRTEIGNTHIDG